MPLGENVGRAYIEVYADGSNVPGGIRDALHDAEPSVREAGREHGKTYGDEFDKSVKGSYKKHFKTTQGEMFGELNDSLTDSLAKLELSKRFFESKKWKQFKDRLSDEFGDAGRLAGKRLEEQFRDGADLDRLADQMRHIGPKVRAAQADLLDALHSDALAENARFDARIIKMRQDMDRDFDRRLRADMDAMAAMLDEAYGLNLDYNRREKSLRDERDAEFERSAKDNASQADRIWKSMQRITDEIDKIGKGGRSVFGRAGLQRDLDALNKLMHSLDTGTSESSENLREWNHDLAKQEERLRTLTPELSRYSRRIDESADKVGRLFGKGSRNNFLNFFGSVTGGLARMFKIIPEGVGWVVRLGREMGAVYDTAGGGAKGALKAFASGISSVGSLAATGAAGLAAFAGFVVVLTLVLGPVIALVSGLVGILVALIGSLAFGGIAVLGAAAGVLGVFAAAAGAVGVAIATMNDEQKKALKNDFRPLVTEARELGKILRTSMFKDLDTQAKRFADTLDGLRPLAKGVGNAIRGVANDWLDMMDGPGFTRFKRSLEDFLPKAIRHLGDAVGQAIGGAGGVFRGMEPFILRTLRWIDRVTDRFNEWANSTDGQRELRQFFSKVGDSAAAIGDFLESAVGWVAKLLDAGRSTGDNIFKNMGEDFQRWGDWLDDHPDAVQKWFGDAEKLSHDIGDLVDSINEFIDTLDRASSRAQASWLVRGLGLAFSMAASQIEFAEDALGGIVGLVQTVGNAFSSEGPIGKGFFYVIGGGWAQDIIDGIGNFDYAGAWNSIRQTVTNAFGRGLGGKFIDTEAISRDVGKVRGIVAGLPEAVRAQLSRIPGIANAIWNRLPNGLTSAISNIRTRWSSIPATIASAISGLPGRISGIFNQIPGKANNAITNIVGDWRGLSGKITTALGDKVSTAVKTKFDAVVTTLSSIPGDIVALFKGLGAAIVSAVGTISIPLSSFNLPNIPYLPDPLARGGLRSRPTYALIGEDGPEAVVPLDRPLSQVDPAVRELSAIAQGMRNYKPMASGGTTRAGVDVGGLTIITPSKDPFAVANEAINQLVAATL